MFGKVSDSESMNPHGIGLGLSICNKILGAMGSKLELQSEYGVGSRFFFKIDLPYKKPIAEPESNIFKESLIMFDYNEIDLQIASSDKFFDIRMFPSFKVPDKSNKLT